MQQNVDLENKEKMNQEKRKKRNEGGNNGIYFLAFWRTRYRYHRQSRNFNVRFELSVGNDGRKSAAAYRELSLNVGENGGATTNVKKKILKVHNNCATGETYNYLAHIRKAGFDGRGPRRWRVTYMRLSYFMPCVYLLL